MAKRTKIPKDIETKVLTSSGRRCCICLGLNRDDAVKKGQIAHLDGDPGNNHIDNLAWLCFDHHEEYDGKTSQARKLSVDEVKVYRRELHEHDRAGGQTAAKGGRWGELALADTPPVFRPTPKTFATNPELVRGGRIVNIGGSPVMLGDSVAVQTLDAAGEDLSYARPVSTEYRVRNPGERLAYEAIAPTAIAALIPRCDVFVGVIVRLEPDRRFESIRLMIPCDPPITGVGPLFPIDVKVEWPSVYEERGLLTL